MKKKDPLFVRESLLNAAFELAATRGMAEVTVNKVSELADVTKGAFFHHFDSTETLVTELMRILLTRLDKQFDRLMAEEENSDGCFTRAYIRAALSEGAAERKVWGALMSLMASKDQPRPGNLWVILARTAAPIYPAAPVTNSFSYITRPRWRSPFPGGLFSARFIASPLKHSLIYLPTAPRASPGSFASEPLSNGRSGRSLAIGSVMLRRTRSAPSVGS
jgi:AcrR family transcriptional regulator